MFPWQLFPILFQVKWRSSSRFTGNRRLGITKIWLWRAISDTYSRANIMIRWAKIPGKLLRFKSKAMVNIFHTGNFKKIEATRCSTSWMSSDFFNSSRTRWIVVRFSKFWTLSKTIATGDISNVSFVGTKDFAANISSGKQLEWMIPILPTDHSYKYYKINIKYIKQAIPRTYVCLLSNRYAL